MPNSLCIRTYLPEPPTLRQSERLEIKKLLLIMKLSVIIMLATVLTASANSHAQKITLAEKNAPLQKIFKLIESQTGFAFYYQVELLERAPTVNIKIKNASIEEVLQILFKALPLTYNIIENNIVIRAKEPPVIEVSNENKIHTNTVVLDFEITGKVTNTEGDGLTGASILLKVSNRTILAGENGKFVLQVPEKGDVLIVSFIGYETKEIPVNKAGNISIILTRKEGNAEEIVVVGYGTQKKQTVTGSISSVKAKDLTVAPVANVTNTLAGRLPGLVSQQLSGLPGLDAANLSIRGFGNALIIIDGVEGSLNRLDPNQIESISILKDGAASIYGARAGNGVILITTKRGTTQKPTITLNSSMTWQGHTKILKPASAGQQAEMARETHLNQGLPPNSAPWTAEQIQKFYDGSDPLSYPNTDWYKELMRPWAPQQQHNVSVRGGSDKIKYYGFLGYLDQETMIKKNGGDYNRYNFQSNIDAKITQDLTLVLNVSGVLENTMSNSRGIDKGGYSQMAVGGDIWQDYWRTQPNYPARLPDPTKNSFANGGGTGGMHLTSNTDISGYIKNVSQDVNGQVSLNYNIKWVKGLSAKAFVGYFRNYSTAKNFKKPYSYYTYDSAANIYTFKGNNPAGPQASLSESWSSNYINTKQYSLNYDNTFNNDHHITALALFESIDYSSQSISASRRDFVSPALDQLFAGSAAGQQGNGNASEMGRSSYVGRLNYSFRNKYLIESILRADASAKFPKDKRWGYFPSVSVGWVASEERFMQQFAQLDFLKLRASLGQSGNDAVGNFQYLAGYQLGRSILLENVLAPTVVPTGLPNPKLTWERMKIYNLGLEYSFFNGKLYGEADVFYRERSGIPATRAASLPSTFGSALPPENLNSTNDRGFEFSVGTRGKLGGLSYNVSGNISWSRAKWDHFEEPEYVDPDQKRINQRSGQWTDRSFGYLSDGLFTDQNQVDKLGYNQDLQGNKTLKPGDIKLLNVNGDTLINFRDQVEIGMGTVPHWIFGTNMSLRYKQFDLSALLQGAFGYSSYVQLSEASTVRFENRWTPQNNDPHALVPRLGGAPTNGNYSDFFYRKQAYVRLKTASLGYNLPKRLLTKFAFEDVRVYAAGMNLLTLSKLSAFGIDPEAPSQGARIGYYYPQQRTISVGVNVSF
jgi:TonB-linked SusC/RagA family outer membrane protein